MAHLDAALAKSCCQAPVLLEGHREGCRLTGAVAMPVARGHARQRLSSAPHAAQSDGVVPAAFDTDLGSRSRVRLPISRSAGQQQL